MIRQRWLITGKIAEEQGVEMTSSGSGTKKDAAGLKRQIPVEADQGKSFLFFYTLLYVK